MVDRFSKDAQAPPHIKVLHDHENVLHHTDTKINEHLYTKDDLKGGTSEKWLVGTDLSTLTDEERGALNTPIS